MKKCVSLFFLIIISCVGMSAQELPNTLLVGSVKVKIDDDARVLIGKEIDYLNSNQKYLNTLVLKMSLYFPIIERVLLEEGVPDEFKYLCVQESAFNPDAVSSSNAIGFWQFKRETAQEVGMRVDGVIDERKHISAATRGAAVYLSRSNLILKNWISTLLSYRMGLGAVRRMTDNDWADKKEITVDASTDWYILRFLAYRYFLEKQYIQSKTNSNPTYLFEYNHSKGKNLGDIAQELDVPLADVVINNTWLKSSSVPDDKDYVVYLPVSNDQYLDLKIKNNQKKLSEDQVAVNQDIGFPVLVKLTQISAKDEPIFYEINGKKGILAQQGDTPELIADRAGINLKRFLKFNDIDENDRIIPNEVYYLKKKDRHAVVAYHTVLGYETLWKISQMYGMQLEDLMQKNRFTQVQRLQKGRLLWLIETRPEGQSIEYVQISEEKTISIVEKISSKVPTSQQSNVQPVKKPVIPAQNTQPEVAIFDSKTDHNAGVNSNNTVITETPPPITNVSKSVNSTTTITQPSTRSVVSTTVYSPPRIINESSNSGKLNNKIIKNHTVEGKQTFFSISRMYNMSIDELYNLNDVYSSSVLRIGQNLKVYQSNSIPITGAVKEEEVIVATHNYPIENQFPVNTNPPTTTIVREVVTIPSENIENTPIISASLGNPSANPSMTVYQSSTLSETVRKPFSPAPASLKPNYKIVHTIQAGETIYRVSKIYKVSVDNLKKWNNLVVNTVEIGQELVIIVDNTRPLVSEETTPTKTVNSPSNTNQYHTLQIGETVYRVSKIYGVTVDEIVKWNNIKNFAVIVGQRLLVKK